MQKTMIEKLKISIKRVFTNTAEKKSLPTSNEELLQYSISLKERPKIQKTLNTFLDIVQSSCSKGQALAKALKNGNTQILVFSDEMMNFIAGEDTQAAHGQIPDGNFLCLRESSLTSDKQSFNLIRQISHEATHIQQAQRFPLLFGDHKSPDYVENIIAFEKEAFANTVEVNLEIAIKEAQVTATETGRNISLHETSMIKNWKQSCPEEASAVLLAFEEGFTENGSFDIAMKRARMATVGYFEQYHESSYRSSALAKTHRAKTAIPNASIHP